MAKPPYLCFFKKNSVYPISKNISLGFKYRECLVSKCLATFNSRHGFITRGLWPHWKIVDNHPIMLKTIVIRVWG